MRLFVYKNAPLVVGIIALLISFTLNALKLLDVIIDNAVALSVTGAAISAFLFTMQSILMTIPAKNAFLQLIRKEGHYLINFHRFCRYAEILFLVNLLPMVYMSGERLYLNLVVFAVYVSALLFAIWSMYLMGSILIKCERHANDMSEAD